MIARYPLAVRSVRMNPVAPDHPREVERLSLLRSYQILDTEPEERFDRLARLAGILTSSPLAAVTLLDAGRVWAKSAFGVKRMEAARRDSFCSHTILGEHLMVVEDATGDERFHENPFVVNDPRIRFYAGAPLITRAGLPLGALCVMDTIPRRLAPEHRALLADLAKLAADEMELHKSFHTLRSQKTELEKAHASLRTANRQLKALAATDGLTGLANRRSLDQAIARELRRARRNRSSVSLLLLDVDHFKSFNDRYGHQAGDECLRQVGAMLKKAEGRAADLAARYGGEEFALLLPETKDAGAMQVAETIRSAVEALAIAHDGSAFGRVTISIGVASMTAGMTYNAGDLIAAADKALYSAKAEGRNRCSVWRSLVMLRAAG